MTPAPPARETGRAANPYVGPGPFARTDAYRFFGRDREVAELYSLVAAHRTVLLYAQSGAGKTSLLNASLIPLLEKGGFDVLPAARVSRLSGDRALHDRIRNVFILNVALAWTAPNSTDEEDGLLEATLEHVLKNRPRKIGANDESLPRVLVFDQFEELFTTYPERWEERRGFFEELDHAMSADPSLRVLFAMREDFVAHVDPYEDLLPEEFRTRYRLERLRAEAALAAVAKPLEGTGIRFKPGVPERLVEDLLKTPTSSAERTVAEEAGSAPPEPAGDAYMVEEFVEPVQLQVVCFSLFRNLHEGATEITEEHLAAYGDVDEALQEFYQSALKEAAGKARIEEDSLRQWFEAKLITEAGTRGLVFRGETSTGGIPNDAVDVLEELHIIRAEVRGRDRWYELSHDRFVKPVLRANDAWRTRVQAQEKKRREAENRRAVEQAQAEAAEQRQSAEQQAKVARRMRQLALVLGLVAVIACAASLFGLWERHKARSFDLRMTSHRLAAVAVNQLDTAPDLSVLLAMHALAAEATPEAIEALNRALLALRPLEFTLTGHSDMATTVAFSPNGKLLASGSQDHTAQIWDANTGKVLHVLSPDPSEGVIAVSFSPDGNRLATAGNGQGLKHQTLRIWDVSTGRELSAVPANGWIIAAVYHPKQPIVATAEVSLVNNALISTIHLWDATDASAGVRAIKQWNVSAQVKALAFSIGGGALAAACADGIVRVWALSDPRKESLTLKGHTDQVMGIAFGPDGQTLASAGMDRTVRIWNPKGENRHTILTGHTNTVFAIAYDSAGRMVSASADARVKVWDPDSGRELLNFAGHTRPVEGVAFTTDGKRAASASWDHTVKVWDAESHRDGITSVAYNFDSSQLATASRDKTVKLWDTKTGRELKTLSFHTDEVNQLAYSRDGQLLAAASNDKRASIWDTVSGKLRMFLPANSQVNAVAFNPNGAEVVVTGEQNGAVELWEVKIGVLPRTLGRHVGAVTGVKFNPAGTLVASGGEDHTVKLWNTASGAVVHTLTGHKLNIMAVAFSPDGSTLASASLDGTVKLWDVASGKELRTISGHTNAVSDVAFSQDGKYLATGSWDRTARIWDVTSGAEQMSFKTETSVNGVAFGHDGKRLAVASEDTVPHLYILEKGDLMQQARDRIRSIGRKLRPEECTKFLGMNTCPPTP